MGNVFQKPPADKLLLSCRSAVVLSFGESLKGFNHLHCGEGWWTPEGCGDGAALCASGYKLVEKQGPGATRTLLRGPPVVPPFQQQCAEHTHSPLPALTSAVAGRGGSCLRKIESWPCSTRYQPLYLLDNVPSHERWVPKGRALQALPLEWVQNPRFYSGRSLVPPWVTWPGPPQPCS